MIFDDPIIDRPSRRTLARLMNGARLDLIAPFARRGPLEQLDRARHHRVRIIVRLPRPGDPLPTRLENDPRDLIALVRRLGSQVSVFGLPGVHTKLYLNGTEAFYGSSNFTNFGFGENPESLLSTSDPGTYASLSAMFTNYLGASTRLSIGYLGQLTRALLNGRVEYIATPEQPVILKRNAAADSEAAFRAWLATQPGPDPTYIEARFDPAQGYNMGGHVQSALPGIRAFLSDNLDLIPVLARANYTPHGFWRANAVAQLRFCQFVQTEGHRFPGHAGGAWSRKLPVSLGGQPGFGGTAGGRGSGLIARMLIYLSRYAEQCGF